MFLLKKIEKKIIDYLVKCLIEVARDRIFLKPARLKKFNVKTAIIIYLCKTMYMFHLLLFIA